MNWFNFNAPMSMFARVGASQGLKKRKDLGSLSNEDGLQDQSRLWLRMENIPKREHLGNFILKEPTRARVIKRPSFADSTGPLFSLDSILYTHGDRLISSYSHSMRCK